MKLRIHALLSLALFAAASHGASSTPALQPFLEEHCFACHDADEKKGGLDLTVLSTDARDAAAHKKWVWVFDRVLSGEMPPPKKAQPVAKEKRAFLTTLGGDLGTKHAAQKGTVLRRLNRREYQNTINDLLGIQIDVVAQLPEDGRAHGFDNIGEALSISGVQLQRYMEVAELALNAALHQESRPETATERFTFDSERNKANLGKHWLKREDGAMVVFNDGGFPSTQVPGLRARTAGRYRLRIAGYGYQSEQPVVVAILAGAFDRGGDNSIHSYHEFPVAQSSTIEVMLHLRANDGIKISPQGLNGPDGHSPIKDGPDKYPGEGFAFQEVTLEGPIIEQWPPRGHTLLLGDLKVREVPAEKPWMKGKRGYVPTFVAESANPLADSRRLLPQFLTQAFRRPVSSGDVAPYLALFETEIAESRDFLVAMRMAAVAALCAPEFLYLQEAAGKLDGFALASRLSYFLTRSAPDAELIRLAAAQQLHQSAVLRGQTERLLKGASLDRFIADFTDGWLNLREIEFTTPDKVLYPEYDGLLLDSMLRETRGFVAALFQENLSVGNLIQSDFALLNGRLAKHYGIPGVAGMALRKTKLPADSKRGGILTQASILKVSANGTNTSPVLRGVWVLERLLGIEPQPPPPGTPGVEPDIRGARTVREILEKHRTMESCNGCHRQIDPPGFALESYDVIGGWRDRFRTLGEGHWVDLKVEGRRVRYRLGSPVDAAGVLPTGETFKDFTEFQKLLLASQDRVARGVAEKLLTFGTGREMGFSDRTEIERIVAASKAKNYALRDLLHLVVQSPIFLSK